jgi:hypothetical protein
MSGFKAIARQVHPGGYRQKRSDDISKLSCSPTSTEALI